MICMIFISRDSKIQGIFCVKVSSLYLMSVISTNHIIKLVEFYLKTDSVIQTQGKFRAFFGLKKALSRSSIVKLVNKFKTEGTVQLT